MTKEELEAWLQRNPHHRAAIEGIDLPRLRAGTGHPLKDALLAADTDAFRFTSHGDKLSPPQIDKEAVGAGQELALHAEIMKECRRRGWPYVYHDPTRRTGATLGCPDFIIYAHGCVLNIECKTKTGKLSKEQTAFAANIRRLGHEYLVVRSLKAFLVICHRGTEAQSVKKIEIRKCSGCKQIFYVDRLKPLFGGQFCQGCLDNAVVEEVD